MTTLAHADGPRAARRAVAACCAHIAAGPVCADSAALLTSELVTNALLHGSGPVTFGVNCGSDLVHVAVGDDSRQHPAVTTTDGSVEGGRGMMLVTALASAWGVTDTPGGKFVWFEVDAQP